MLKYLPILDRLIGFPTVSSRTNLDCIDYIEGFLSEHGFWTCRFADSDNLKANLLARLGPETAGGLMLAGHTDVVPVAGQDWASDPFSLCERGGSLHGRGTADMKGFIALVLAAAAELDQDRLKRPLYLAFTYDEETGCLGAKRLVEEIKRLGLWPAFVLIGEPTGMEVVTAHKGICISTTRVAGIPAHACNPGLGANAIVAAARLIRGLEGILPVEGDGKFDPPAATVNVGTIRGGAATNIIAGECAFEWELRPLPQQDPGDVLDAYHELIRELEEQLPGIAVDNRVDARVPGLQDNLNRGIAGKLQALAGLEGPATAAFTTEAGLYQAAGIPAVVCGPGHVSQAHQPDERVERETLDRFQGLLGAIIEQYTFV